MDCVAAAAAAIGPADLLAAALAVTPDGFAIHRAHRDPDGGITGFILEMINKAGAAPFTDDPASLVGRDVETLLGPSSVPMVEAFRRALTTGQLQRVRTTFSGTAAAGTTDSIAMRIDDNLVLSTWRDVTDQIVGEQILQDALRQANERSALLGSALDAAEDAFVVLEVPAVADLGPAELEGRFRVVHANRSSALSLGLERHQVAGARLDQIVGRHWGAELGGLVVEAVRADAPRSRRVVVLAPGGAVQDARHVTVTPMPGARVLLVSRDASADEWVSPTGAEG
ncbi:hypothetical protein [Kineosporia sp. A_224]|uniref:hypothetical protein n=1 Tax=Kineosporia sp. A_224 TaxID=1962180 RepID=UPI001179C649|nr:hypothetical protein [Kineosporia sp. A_224]